MTHARAVAIGSSSPAAVRNVCGWGPTPPRWRARAMSSRVIAPRSPRPAWWLYLPGRALRSPLVNSTMRSRSEHARWLPTVDADQGMALADSRRVVVADFGHLEPMLQTVRFVLASPPLLVRSRASRSVSRTPQSVSRDSSTSLMVDGTISRTGGTMSIIDETARGRRGRRQGRSAATSWTSSSPRSSSASRFVTAAIERLPARRRRRSCRCCATR